MTRTEQDLRAMYEVAAADQDEAEIRLAHFARSLAEPRRSDASRQQHRYQLAAALAVVLAAVLSTALMRRTDRGDETRPAKPTATNVRLVAAPATPLTAPFTLGVLPRGWRFLTASRSHVYFSGPDRPATSRYYGIAGNLGVTIEYDRSGGSYPLRIGGRPASIVRDTQTGAPILEIRQTREVVIAVQVPESLRALTNHQLIELGSSIRTRFTSEPEGN